jgi:outer membrane protein assembly factor BamD
MDTRTSGRAGRRTFALRLVAGAMLATVLAACSTSKEGTPDAYADDRPAGTLYNEGLAYMNAGKMTDAIKSFNEVDRQHPYSEWARKALIMSAFASYRSGRYDDTVDASQRYLTLYPGSEDAPYAQYLIGSSYFRQIPDVTRDQDATRRAMASLNDIISHYPNSEYASDAQQKILMARDQLAGKEMQIGRYYLERRELLAAVNRFRTVVTDYQDTRHVEEALERLTESYLTLGITSEAQTAAAVLGHNFPNSRWYKDAYSLLQKKGVLPENHGGPVGDAFNGKTAT